jgi:hypothetical protein
MNGAISYICEGLSKGVTQWQFSKYWNKYFDYLKGQLMHNGGIAKCPRKVDIAECTRLDFTFIFLKSHEHWGIKSAKKRERVFQEVRRP